MDESTSAPSAPSTPAPLASISSSVGASSESSSAFAPTAVPLTSAPSMSESSAPASRVATSAGSATSGLAVASGVAVPDAKDPIGPWRDGWSHLVDRCRNRVRDNGPWNKPLNEYEAQAVDAVDHIVHRLAESKVSLQAELTAATSLEAEMAEQKRQVAEEREMIEILSQQLKAANEQLRTANELFARGSKLTTPSPAPSHLGSARSGFSTKSVADEENRSTGAENAGAVDMDFDDLTSDLPTAISKDAEKDLDPFTPPHPVAPSPRGDPQGPEPNEGATMPDKGTA